MREVSVMGGSSRSGYGKEETGVSYKEGLTEMKSARCLVPHCQSATFIRHGEFTNVPCFFAPFKTCRRPNKTSVLAPAYKKILKRGTFRSSTDLFWINDHASSSSS